MKLLNQEWSMVPTTKQISHLINKINLEPDLMNNENKLNPAVQLERQHYRNGSNKSTTSQYSLDTVQGHCFKKKITVRTRKLWNRKKTLKD